MQNYISMEKKFKEYQPNQLMLLPPCISDWLPEDHPVHYISEVVEDLDLSAIYQNYRGRRGQPPYEPKMMVKIFIYGVVKGIFSSRKIEKALYEDVGFRILSANQQPDHWTISEFRRRHHKALGELLVQTIQMSDKAGLVKLEHISVDGTKIKANASKHSAMSYGYMKKEEKRLQEEIESILERMEEIDVEEDKKYGNRRGDELPPELATRQKRLAAIKKAKKELEEEAKEKLRKKQAERQEKAKKEGKKYKPRKNIEQALLKDKDQRNFTDPESRIMLNSEKAFIQGYNAQATVDAESQIIVAADLTNEANDKRQLVPQIEQVIQNTGRTPKEMSADTGYYSDDNLEYLRKRKIEGFIPPEKVTHNQWRTQNAIRGRIPKNASKDYLMRRKLRTKRGRERYKLRQTSIEPTYGYIKEELGLRQFLLRGQDKVRSIWRFTCAVHNILKLYRAEMRFAKAV